jgi:hypothetical protein
MPDPTRSDALGPLPVALVLALVLGVGRHGEAAAEGIKVRYFT